jgi:hypothetical protein
MFVKKLVMLGWLYDVDWDPYGMGLIVSGSDTATVSSKILICANC